MIEQPAMTERDLEDAQSMGRVAGGDQEALALLFDRHAPVVLGVLCRMLAARAEAEEILQETFLQAWREAGRFRPGLATPRGWLLMLARSRALDRLRADRARQQRELASRQDWRSLAVEPAGEARLAAAEGSERLTAALGALPSEQRECLELAFFAGLTHRQIAARLQEPLGTVRSRILLGMNTLRAALAPWVR